MLKQGLPLSEEFAEKSSAVKAAEDPAPFKKTFRANTICA
jgi:hypothetical protein